MSYDYRIGRILRAHGLRGDVTIQLFRPRRGLSEKRKKPKTEQRVAVGDQQRALLAVQAIGPDRLIAGFEGIEDRDAAEQLEGLYLDVDPKALPGLITDELDRVFAAEVVDLEGAPIGEVVDIRDNGAQAILLVGEEEILIPENFLVEVRSEGDRTIAVVDVPEGLLDVNRARDAD